MGVVVGALTGGGDAGTAALSLTPALLPSGAGTPLPGDVPVCFTSQNSGTDTLLSSSPTQVVDAGPTIVGTILTTYEMCEVGGLTAADVTANSLTYQWSASARNLSCGVLLRGVSVLGRVIGTPITGTTGLSILVPTITAPAGSTVVVCVVARNAQTTPPTIATAGLTGAGYTIGRAVATANATSPNFAMLTATIANFAGGSVGGTSITLGNTPTASETFIVAYPALAPLPNLVQRRRPVPWRGRSRTAVSVPSVPTTLPSIGGRRRQQPQSQRRRVAASLPIPVVVAATPLPTQRRRLIPPMSRRRRDANAVTLVVFTATLPVPAARSRRVPPPPVHRRALALPPALPDLLASARRIVRTLLPRRRRDATVLGVGGPVPTPVLPVPRRRLIQPALRRRGPTPVLGADVTPALATPRRHLIQPALRRRVAAVSPPLSVVVATLPVPSVRRRQVPSVSARRRAAVALAQPVVVATLPVPASRRRLLPPWLHRRGPAVALAQPVIVAATPVPGQRRHLVQPAIRSRRPGIALTQPVIATTLPVPAPRRRLVLPARARRATAAIVGAPDLLLAAVRRRLVQPVSRRRREAVALPQPVLTVATIVPAARRRLVATWNRRRAAQAVPPIPLLAATGPVPSVRRRLLNWARPLRRPAVAIPTVVAAPVAAPLPNLARRRGWTARLRRTPRVPVPTRPVVLGVAARSRRVRPPAAKRRPGIAIPIRVAAPPVPTQRRRLRAVLVRRRPSLVTGAGSAVIPPPPAPITFNRRRRFSPQVRRKTVVNLRFRIIPPRDLVVCPGAVQTGWEASSLTPGWGTASTAGQWSATFKAGWLTTGPLSSGWKPTGPGTYWAADQVGSC